MLNWNCKEIAWQRVQCLPAVLHAHTLYDSLERTAAAALPPPSLAAHCLRFAESAGSHTGTLKRSSPDSSTPAPSANSGPSGGAGGR